MDVASGLKINTGVGFLAYTSKTFIGIALPKTFKTQISVSEPGVATYERMRSGHCLLRRQQFSIVKGGYLTPFSTVKVQYHALTT